MKQLFWKELRDQRWTPVVCVAFMALYIIISKLVVGDLRWFISLRDLIGLMAWMSPISGLLAGVGLFVGEIENDTLFFLTALPISRTRIWLVKVSSGMAAMALSGITAFVVGLLVTRLLGGNIYVHPSMQEPVNKLHIMEVGIAALVLPLWCFAVSIVVSALTERIFSSFMLSALTCITLGLSIVVFAQYIGGSPFNELRVWTASMGQVVITLSILLIVSYARFAYVKQQRPWAPATTGETSDIDNAAQRRGSGHSAGITPSRATLVSAIPFLDPANRRRSMDSPSGLKQLLWKEWLDLWYVPIIWVLSVAPWPIALWVGFDTVDWTLALRFAWALAALNIGCSLFSSEEEQGTLRFLTILPIGHARIWAIKTGIGLATLILTMVLASLVWTVEYHWFLGVHMIPRETVIYTLIETFGIFAVSLALSQVSERSTYTVAAAFLLYFAMRILFFMSTPSLLPWLIFSTAVAPMLLVLSYWTFTRGKAR